MSNGTLLSSGLLKEMLQSNLTPFQVLKIEFLHNSRFYVNKNNAIIVSLVVAGDKTRLSSIYNIVFQIGGELQEMLL